MLTTLAESSTAVKAAPYAFAILVTLASLAFSPMIGGVVEKWLPESATAFQKDVADLSRWIVIITTSVWSVVAALVAGLILAAADEDELAIVVAALTFGFVAILGVAAPFVKPDRSKVV